MNVLPRLFLIFTFLLCSCTTIKRDTSPSAFEFGEMSLIHSACKAAPSQGLDICRVVDGAQIVQNWIMILPVRDGFESGEVRVRYKDYVKTFRVTKNEIVIPWRDIVGHDYWQLDDEAPVQAVGKLMYKDGTGVVFMDTIGVAFIMVLKKGYSPLPVDSGAEFFSTTCKIQYSSAGRSAIECSK